MILHNSPSGLAPAGCYEEMTSDGKLLRDYADARSEDAFAELVRRHLDLVYSAALRQVNGDTQAAQDIVQTVFRDLASKAAALSTRESLTGWLYTSTHFAAAKLVRTENRRRAREQKAHAMHELLDAPAPDPDWEELRPVLDEAMHELRTSERDVILLRYFENRPLAFIGEQLGLGEDAARKRVDRALEKLRRFLSRRGVTATTGLASALSANAVQLAPAGLAATLTAVSLSGAAGAGSTFALWQLITMTKLKFAAISVVLAASVAVPWMVQHQTQKQLRDEVRSLQTQADELPRLQAENDRLTALLARTRTSSTESNASELLRLRGEVGMLRRTTNDLAALQAENRRLQARSAASARNPDAPESSEIVPKESWEFKGYSTPEATAQSLLWALREGSTNAYQAYLDGLAPKERAEIEREAAAHGGPTAFAELGNHETGEIKSFRIVRRIELNDDSVILQMEATDPFPPITVVMKKFGDNWKMGEIIK